jgi:hypothetical protein
VCGVVRSLTWPTVLRVEINSEIGGYSKKKKAADFMAVTDFSNTESIQNMLKVLHFKI